MPRKTNLILIGVDSLRADHMSLCGYRRLTTPHLDRLAAEGTVFESCFSPHIPTTPGYGGMLTGMDCFSTGLISLGHRGPVMRDAVTLGEILAGEGYATTCIGFGDEPAGGEGAVWGAVRGFQRYLDYPYWERSPQGRCPKGEHLNAVAIPELARLAGGDRPFFLFLRPMDPHAPYLPPGPFERMFYGGDEFDPDNTSMDPVMEFRPFRDFFASWMPPGCTDKDYVIAQYDGAVAYMDACIANLLTVVRALGLEEDTLIVFDSDHGESLYDHECWFDHHGLYETNLHVPLVFRLPGPVPAGRRIAGNVTLLDVTPTILEILGVEPRAALDGHSLLGWMSGGAAAPTEQFYITECTWMRKHGWRTPRWKYIHALEPDFHFKPAIELYDLREDPGETVNLADSEPEVVARLERRMLDWIERRQRETGRDAPIYTNYQWHGAKKLDRRFADSQEAYEALRIGPPGEAERTWWPARRARGRIPRDRRDAGDGA